MFFSINLMNFFLNTSYIFSKSLPVPFNAKLRLSKLNLEEMDQIMRGKSKRIKN